MPDELTPQGEILLCSSGGEKEFVTKAFYADYISEFDRQTAKYRKGGGDQ